MRTFTKKYFQRSDLLFVNNLTELIEVEKLIVTQEFQLDPRTMNYSFHPQYAEILRMAGGEFITLADKKKLEAIQAKSGEINLNMDLHTLMAQVSLNDMLNSKD